MIVFDLLFVFLCEIILFEKIFEQNVVRKITLVWMAHNPSTTTATQALYWWARALGLAGDHSHLDPGNP